MDDVNDLGKLGFNRKLSRKTKETGSKHNTLVGQVGSHRLTILKVLYTGNEQGESRRMNRGVPAESETTVQTRV